MSVFQRSLTAVLIALVSPMLVAGCGGPPQPVNSPEQYEVGSLEEVGQLYAASHDATKKAPKSLKDLVRADLFLGGFNSIKNGDIIVYWGVTPVTPGTDGADEVLAYGAGVPEKGGYVLLKDLSMKVMSPSDFQAAPKPSGSTSAETKGEAK